MSEEPEEFPQLPARRSDDKPETVAQSAIPPKERNTVDYWAYIGKAGVLVALIIGTITIYNTFNPRGPRVVARCSAVEISDYLTYGEEHALTRIKKKLSIDTISLAMPHEAGKPANSESVLETLTANLSQQLLGTGYDRFEDRYRENTLALQCTIINDGTEPATEVALLLPYQPIRVFVNKIEVNQTDPRSQSISLGTLAAGPALRLEAWIQTHSLLRYENKNFFLNYRGGTGKVHLGQTYFGTADTLANFWDTVGMFFLIMMIVALSLFVLSVIILQGQAKPSKRL